MRPSLFIIVPALALSNSESLDPEPEPDMKLSDEDEALIKHTLRTLTFITLETNADNLETRPLKSEVSDEELEEMKLSSEEFASFLGEVNQNLNSDEFKLKAREKNDFADALSELIARLLPKRSPNPVHHENSFENDDASYDTLIDFDTDNEDIYDGVETDFIPIFESIDHLSENTFLDDPKCPETWIYNNIQAEGCVTALRSDKRPWCSLDKIFTGNFIFCTEDEAIKLKRVNELKAEELYNTAANGLMENLKPEKYDLYKVMLDQAIELGSKNALVTKFLQQIFGYIYEQKIEEPMQRIQDIANEGNAKAQAIIGMFHGSGFFVEHSQSRAVLNLKFAALGNDNEAKMALGNKYLHGLGVRKSCPNALYHYQFVAEKVATAAKTLTHSPYVSQSRILDEDEIKDDQSAEVLLDDELLEYYSYLSNKGDVHSQVSLAQLLLQRGFDDDVSKAAQLFQEASNSGNALGAAFLGRMYLEGVGVPASNLTAFKLFKLAADQGNAIGQAGMGVMYLEGRATQINPRTAVKYFQASADQGWNEGQLRLGLAYMKGDGVRKDTTEALKYLTLASKEHTAGFGNLLAFWYMAEIFANNKDGLSSINCMRAVSYYKFVAEHGPWNKLFTHAWRHWKNANIDSALAIFSYLAELGYEKAQSNLATILDDHVLKNDILSRNNHERAFMNWKRASNQNFPAARLRVGDHHWYGLGVERNYAQAALYYRMCSEDNDPHASAQALFNLGYMHHFGMGLPKDYHLSKRFYDAAAEKSTEGL